MLLLKCYTQYVSKFEKLSRGHRSGNGQFLFQSQRSPVSKNVSTTLQLNSFYMLQRLSSKFSKLGLSSTWTRNFQTYKMDLEKAEEPEIKLPAFVGSYRKQGNSEKHLLCFIDFIKAFDCVDHNSLWLCGSQQTAENSERDENTRPPYLPPEKSVCSSRSNS